MKMKNYLQQDEKARQQWRGLQALTRLVEEILASRY